jgi:hypothetical protein
MQITVALEKFRVLIFHLLTWNYAGSLNHYTIEPISKIEENQRNVAGLPSLIYEFKIRKEQELQFVQRAVSLQALEKPRFSFGCWLGRKAALSAAAVIGICSWTDVAISFWVSQMFWHCSLSFSIVALISSAHQRLLESFPSSQEQADNLTEGQLRAILRVFLKSRKGGVDRSRESEDVEQGRGAESMRSDKYLVWVWQSPMMMMSHSWVWFLLGYAFYIMSPLIEHDSQKLSSAASGMKSVVCSLKFISAKLSPVVTFWLERDYIDMRSIYSSYYLSSQHQDCGASYWNYGKDESWQRMSRIM